MDSTSVCAVVQHGKYWCCQRTSTNLFWKFPVVYLRKKDKFLGYSCVENRFCRCWSHISIFYVYNTVVMPSVLWHCWFGVRKSIWPVRNLSDEVLAWLSVWNEVRVICMWSSWCHCHSVISCFFKIQIDLTFLVPTYLGCPRKEPINRVSVWLSYNNVVQLGVFFSQIIILLDIYHWCWIKWSLFTYNGCHTVLLSVDLHVQTRAVRT